MHFHLFLRVCVQWCCPLEGCPLDIHRLKLIENLSYLNSSFKLSINCSWILLTSVSMVNDHYFLSLGHFLSFNFHIHIHIHIYTYIIVQLTLTFPRKNKGNKRASERGTRLLSQPYIFPSLSSAWKIISFRESVPPENWFGNGGYTLQLSTGV